MAAIEFTKDFAGKKKGFKWANCPNGLAGRLVKRGVAKLPSPKAKPDKK